MASAFESFRGSNAPGVISIGAGSRLHDMPASMAGRVPRWLEPLWLGEQAGAAARVDEPTRDGLRQALDAGEQKASAAETLWQGGHGAEALVLARASVEAVAQGLPALERALSAREARKEDPAAPSGAEPEGPGVADQLRRGGAGADAAARAEATLTALPGLTLPDRDRDVGPEAGETYRRLSEAYRTFAETLRRAGRTRGDVLVARGFRIGAVAAIVATAVVALFLGLRPQPPRVRAEASEYFANDPGFRPDNVLDRRPDTNWLLSDDTAGFVELRFTPPRDIDGVTLQNARNAPYFDRSTKGFRLELRRGGRVVARTEGELNDERAPEPVSIDISADEVDALRVYVDSWHGKSGGLAEVRWKEATPSRPDPGATPPDGDD